MAYGPKLLIRSDPQVEVQNRAEHRDELNLPISQDFKNRNYKTLEIQVYK